MPWCRFGTGNRFYSGLAGSAEDQVSAGELFAGGEVKDAVSIRDCQPGFAKWARVSPGPSTGIRCFGTSRAGFKLILAVGWAFECWVLTPDFLSMWDSSGELFYAQAGSLHVYLLMNPLGM